MKTTGSKSSSPSSPKKASTKARPQKRKLAKSESSDDDVPLAAPAKQVAALVIHSPSNGKVMSEDVPIASGAVTAAASTPLKAPKSEMDDSDEDVPLKANAKAKAAKKTRAAKAKPRAPESSDSEDAALAAKTRRPPRGRQPPNKRSKVHRLCSQLRSFTHTFFLFPRQKSEESEAGGGDSDDVFAASSSKAKKPRAPPRKKPKVEAKDEELSPSKSPTKKNSKKEEEEEMYRWWETEALGDGTQKWTTLEHNGVLFPPPYEPLPKTVKLHYLGGCTRMLYILESY